MRYGIKKFFNVLFHVLGVIFFLIICAGTYLWFADPFGIRPLVDALTGNAKAITTEVVSGVEEKATADKNPALNIAQERALETVGIDPAKVPSKITPEQEKCFTEKLGAERVAEIKGGASPSTTEIFTARSCIE
ncbi:MAG: hypothetical protein KBD24_03675 [Candidatus Pacebacteria bacterium]|nr:hypothetical protein [Candidatus Paceibacterota bacterium]